MLIALQTMFLLLLSSNVSPAPQASESTPEPFDKLSLGHQRYLEDVAEHYWLAPGGVLWSSQVQDEGIGENVAAMNDEVAEGRADAYLSPHAPRWYDYAADIRMPSRTAVLDFHAYLANIKVYEDRRAFGESHGHVIADRCMVVAVPVSGGGVLVNFDFGDGFEDRDSWLRNHPLARNASPGDILLIDNPIIMSGTQRFDNTSYESWNLNTKIDLREGFPTSRPSDFELIQLSPRELAQIMYSRGLERLPEWKLVKIKVSDAVPGKKTVRRRSHGGASFVTSTSVRKGRPAVYEWVYRLSWKPIRFKDD